MAQQGRHSQCRPNDTDVVQQSLYKPDACENPTIEKPTSDRVLLSVLVEKKDNQSIKDKSKDVSGIRLHLTLYG